MNKHNTNREPTVDILIVEDSETQADHLAHLLAAGGYRVQVAGNGREGLSMAKASKPNLIVSDITMPEMDGFTMCAHLKSDELLRDVPVILLTSLRSVHDVIKGLNCGADNFIRKPFDGKYLLGRIRVILANRALRSDERVQLGMQVSLGGQTHFISAERQQMFDLLLSTYEEAIQMTEELRRQQQQIASSYQSLEGLYNIAEALNTSISEGAVAEAALERLLDFPGVLGGCIKLSDSAGTFRVAAARDFGTGPYALDICSACTCEQSLMAGQLRAPQVITRCPALEQDARRGEHAASHISVPITIGGHALGVLNLLKDPTDCTEDTFHVLETVGNQIATALERARLYTDMETLVKERTKAFQAERNLLSAVMNTTGALILLLDPAGRITMFNPACERTLGWKFEEVRGRFYWELFLKPAQAKAAIAFLKNPESAKSPLRVQSEWLARDGSVRYILWSSTYLNKADQPAEYFLGTGIDITELRGAEERIQYLSNFDSRTGLPNQILLGDRMQQLQHRIMAGKNMLGLLLLRFERLPRIRESLGSTAEQALMRQIAARLKDWAGERDDIARIGENSFAVAVIRQSLDDISVSARHILQRMDTPFDFEHQELHIEACIGIAVMSNDGNEFDKLLQQAEVAVRRVLESGAERFEFYKPEFNRAAKERFKLESALRRAVERNELLLHYQPQVDLATGRIIGAEALLRWQHPELGMVPPGHFISLAEDTGLIVPIGAWVIRTACAQARRWLNSGSGDMRIAVNLSARQFNQPELVDMIASIVEQTELPAHCLEIELTETLVMTDVGRNVEVLNKLRELGIKLAIDDFGTGYSSLSYLKRFPIDMLKIDQSFVKELCQNANDAAIASAIISMAHSMGMKVIAEGVETEEQCEFLAQQGCDEIQGYLFSRPLASNDFESLLREGQRLPQYLLRK